MRLTRTGRLTLSLLVAAALVAVIVVIVTAVGSTTAHAVPPATAHSAGHDRSATPSAAIEAAISPPTATAPPPPVVPDIPARLADAQQGTWTTTGAHGKTVHRLARGTVVTTTPAVLIVRTSSGARIAFAVTSRADTIPELRGGQITDVSWKSIRTGLHVTLTGPVPQPGGVPVVGVLEPTG